MLFHVITGQWDSHKLYKGNVLVKRHVLVTRYQNCNQQLGALLEDKTENANVACTNYVPRSRAELKFPILYKHKLCALEAERIEFISGSG